MKTGGKTCAACGERYEPEVLFCPLDGTPLSSSRSLASSAHDIDPYLHLDLAGQIRLSALVGIGSMGRVYRAFQGGVDRDVAVKILHRELSGNAELVGRFHREAKIASRLVHPNVVQVLMTGTLPATGDARTGGEVYLVMEYLDGISLLSALAAASGQGDGGALPLPRALHIVLQLCDAVGEAHAQNIVHRDLKPENIMLVRRGEDPDVVKVLDFGIARLDWASSEGHSTQAGLIFGTAKYISPEGAEGKPVGPRADVYAIATILFQCLAGRAPFEGDSPMSLLVQQIHAPPPELNGIARSSYVPQPIAQVIMGNLAKNPADRAEDARALGRELSLAAREAGIAVDTLGPSGGTKRPLGLASKQRTKQHDFSQELRAKIASIPVPMTAPVNGPGYTVYEDDEAPTSGDPTEMGSHPDAMFQGNGANGATASQLSERATVAARRTQLADDYQHDDGDTIPGLLDSRSRASHPDDDDAPRPGPTIPGSPLDHASEAAAAGLRRSAPASRASNPQLGPFPSARSSNPGLGYGAPRGSRPGVSAHPNTVVRSTDATLAPSESSPEPPLRRPKWVWLVLALLIVPAIAFGAVRIFGNDASDEASALEAQVSAAEDAMERRAWDAPPGENVKELTDHALDISPGDRRVIALRREAAERIVSDALGRKYASAHADALRLARLALALSPDLTTAQLLVRELESSSTMQVAPDPSNGAQVVPSERPRDVPRPGTARPRPSASASPRASADPGKPAPTTQPGPAPLPPQPTDDLTPPPPNSSRPWL